VITAPAPVTDETHDLLRAAAQAPDDERSRIEELLTVRHMALVRRLASRYARRGADTEDLVQVASIALVKAMRRFDVDKGDFVPFARATILGEIKRHFRDSCWAVRPPRRMQELQADVQAAVELRVAEGHREPTVAEIAEELGASVAEVREAHTAADCYAPRSLDHPTGASGRPLADSLRVEDDSYDFVDEWTTVSPLCRSLDAEDRRLLVLRFVEDKTQQEIGADLGISQMQVSRRLRRLLDDLHDRVSTDPAA
jgi:RNA polymerase sigma-B factor